MFRQMASKNITCAGCRSIVDSREYLKCIKCCKYYDLPCANIFDRKIYTAMNKEQKAKWTCHECRSKQPKLGNVNTPVRNIKDGEVNSSNLHDDDAGLTNVTFRRKQCGEEQKTPTCSPGSASCTFNRDDAFVSAISDKVLKAIKSELPGMISSILKTELNSIKNDLIEFRQSVDFLSTMHDEMKNMMETLVKDNAMLSKENTVLKTQLSDLSERLNNLEQHLRENNLEIQGVPEHRNEDLPNLIHQCSKVIGHNLQEGDIIKCTRVAKLNKESKYPRAIIVKFNSVRNRDNFYSAVHRYNKSNPSNKLNTALLGIAGDKMAVYVSEHLSPTNKSLHAAARKKAKEQGYKFIWIKNGRIFVRKTIDSKYILIKGSDSLDLIC